MIVNPNLVKEDKMLSSVIIDCRKSTLKARASVSHLKESCFYGFSIRNLNVWFTPVIMQAIEKKMFTKDEKTKLSS